MMLKVLKPFRDKETGAEYSAGDLAEFTEARAAQILNDRRKLAESAEIETPKQEKRRSRKK